MLYRAHLAWMGFELTISVMISTDCIGSCTSNYHTITSTTAISKIEFYPIILVYILFLFLSTRHNFFYYQSQLHIKREFFKAACWLITKYEDSHVTTGDWMDHFEGLIASFTWNISYKKYVREFRLHFKWQFLKKTPKKLNNYVCLLYYI